MQVVRPKKKLKLLMKEKQDRLEAEGIDQSQSSRPSKNTTYLLKSYQSYTVSFKQFKRLGARIQIVPRPGFRFPKQTGSEGATAANINVVNLRDQNEICMCWKNNVVLLNLNPASKPQVLSSKASRICNYVSYKAFDIFFQEDNSVLFLHKSGNMRPIKSDMKFCGDYCGGYHSYSRSVEVRDNWLLFLRYAKAVEGGTSSTLVMYNLDDLDGLLQRADKDAEMSKAFGAWDKAKKKLHIGEGSPGPITIESVYVKDNHDSRCNFIKGIVLSELQIENFFIVDNYIYTGTGLGQIHQFINKLDHLYWSVVLENPYKNVVTKKFGGSKKSEANRSKTQSLEMPIAPYQHAMTKPPDSARKALKAVCLATFAPSLTAMNFYHGNIFGASFNLPKKQVTLHLLNLKHNMTTELLLEDQLKPIHNITMFTRRKVNFGVVMSRGFHMHLIGIYWCKMFMLQSNVKVASEYSSGIFFLNSEEFLVYGAQNYAEKFQIRIRG